MAAAANPPALLPSGPGRHGGSRGRGWPKRRAGPGGRGELPAPQRGSAPRLGVGVSFPSLQENGACLVSPQAALSPGPFQALVILLFISFRRNPGFIIEEWAKKKKKRERLRKLSPAKDDTSTTRTSLLLKKSHFPEILGLVGQSKSDMILHQRMELGVLKQSTDICHFDTRYQRWAPPMSAKPEMPNGF